MDQQVTEMNKLNKVVYIKIHTGEIAASNSLSDFIRIRNGTMLAISFMPSPVLVPSNDAF